MSPLDWSQCEDVESVPGKVSGAWVLCGTRMPIRVIFENLEAGVSMNEITELFPVSREQVEHLLAFVTDSVEVEPAKPE